MDGVRVKEDRGDSAIQKGTERKMFPGMSKRKFFPKTTSIRYCVTVSTEANKGTISKCTQEKRTGGINERKKGKHLQDQKGSY